MILGACCEGKVYNMLPGSIMLMGAYCVGKVHNNLPPRENFDFVLFDLILYVPSTILQL